MKSIYRDIKKILSVTICLILLSTTFASSFSSRMNNNEISFKANSEVQTKESAYNLLIRLIERFPFLENVSLIKALLDFFSVPNTAEIQILKSSDVESAKIGELINYSYKVTNIGQIFLYNIYLEDDKLGSISLNKTSLASGEWAYGEASYVVKESDLPGPIVNIATVNASYCDNQETGRVEDTDELSITIDVDQPGIRIIKKADKEFATIGELINYSYKVTNIGQIFLYNIYLEDDKLGSISLNKTSLSPGQWASGKLSYEVTLEDCDTTIVNTATINASYCDLVGEAYIEDSDTASVSIRCGEPNIKIVKKADTTLASVGDTITYSYTVKNTGDIALFEISVFDNPLGTISLNTTTLYPGQWAYGEKTYIVKESDLPGPIINTAEAVGYTSTQKEVTDDTILTIPLVIPCKPVVWVDDNYNEQTPGWQIDRFNTVQDGVDAVCDCGTVYILPGDYREQVLITKNVSIIGEPKPTIPTYRDDCPSDGTDDTPVSIIAPSTLTTYNIEGKLVSPIIFAKGESCDEFISVRIEGIGVHPENTVSHEVVGIYFHNVKSGCVEALIKDCIIEDQNDISDSEMRKRGTKSNTVGIKIDGCSENILIDHNFIYQRICIKISEANGNEPKNIKIHHNFLGDHNRAYGIGLQNEVSNMVIATKNYWGQYNGPSGPSGGETFDAITNRRASGYGERIIGIAHFDPWWGLDASGTVTVLTDRLVLYDASQSFAYDSTGYINGSLKYLWNFEPRRYSTFKSGGYVYDTYGTKNIQLRVECWSFDLDGLADGFTGTWFNWAYFKVTVGNSIH